MSQYCVKTLNTVHPYAVIKLTKTEHFILKAFYSLSTCIFQIICYVIGSNEKPLPFYGQFQMTTGHVFSTFHANCGDNLQKNVKPYFLSKIISSEIFPAC